MFWLSVLSVYYSYSHKEDAYAISYMFWLSVLSVYYYSHKEDAECGAAKLKEAILHFGSDIELRYR